ncbi:MAG: hypothetical protein DRJ21_00615 [Candidatus Methanomethylicota archaeon]|uniref:Branched-chain amino acid ABC transporter permease n=1 Tax=Thermoproteota archaeon TaxID=2056631 RepID=A0A497EW55_9CREN|nr:MAG: hypothetical protein DRJ21_00615 [Candidatus Verstraetearchaeota archaeon]
MDFLKIEIKEMKFKTIHYIALIFLVILVMAPFTPLSARLPFLYLTLFWIVFVGSFNIITGFTGYVPFGQVMFLGAGSYAAVLSIVKLGISPYIAIIIGGLASMALAFIIGYPTLRLRGAYFSIATIALNEALKVIIYNAPEEITGGPMGVTLPTELFEPIICYYLMLSLAVITVLITYFIANSKFGMGLMAIREDEDAAAVLGVNAHKLKLMAFMISALIAGMAGSIHAWRTMYIEAVSEFEIHKTVIGLAMLMFGGAGTVTGPILGATILYTIEDYFWAQFPFAHMIIVGLIIIVVVLFVPQGLVGWLRQKMPKMKELLF